MCPLTANRQRAAMSQTSITSNVHQALDIHLDALPQIAFDLTLRFQNRPDPTKLVFIQVADAIILVDSRLGQNGACARTTDAVDIRQPYFSPLMRWKINPSYTCHLINTLRV